MSGRRGLVLDLILYWVAFVILWMLLISKWDATEFFAGLGAGAIAAIAAAVTHRNQERHYHFVKTPYSVLQAWRLPVYIVKGAWQVLSALARQLLSRKGAESRLRAVDFDMAGEKRETAENRARFALAITLPSGTPNFVVLGIDSKNELLLFHQIVPSPVPLMLRNLGAGRKSTKKRSG